MDRVINQIRNSWQDFEVFMRKESGWVPSGKKCHGMKKPHKAVRTRWLSVIDSLNWLLPNLEMVKSIIRKYFLKDKNGKQRKNWVKVWRILNKAELAQVGHFVHTWGIYFFKPGLKWIEKGMQEKEDEEEKQTASGFRAPEMPPKVREWKREVEDMCTNYKTKFKSTIEVMGGKEEDDKTCKDMVRQFADSILDMINKKFGQWSKVCKHQQHTNHPQSNLNTVRALYTPPQQHTNHPQSNQPTAKAT